MGKTSSDYIFSLQKQLGRTLSLEEVCSYIHERNKEIDQALHAADALRIEKVNNLDVLRDLGDDSVKRHRISPQAPSIELDVDSDEQKQIRQMICEAIAEFSPITNRDLIQKIGSYQEESKWFFGIKVLGEKNIIARDDERRLIPGENWDKRIES